jgi:hypothetical protein
LCQGSRGFGVVAVAICSPVVAQVGAERRKLGKYNTNQQKVTAMRLKGTLAVLFGKLRLFVSISLRY